MRGENPTFPCPLIVGAAVCRFTDLLPRSGRSENGKKDLLPEVPTVSVVDYGSTHMRPMMLDSTVRCPPQKITQVPEKPHGQSHHHDLPSFHLMDKFNSFPAYHSLCITIGCCSGAWGQLLQTLQMALGEASPVKNHFRIKAMLRCFSSLSHSPARCLPLSVKNRKISSIEKRRSKLPSTMLVLMCPPSTRQNLSESWTGGSFLGCRCCTSSVSWIARASGMLRYISRSFSLIPTLTHFPTALPSHD